MLCIGTDVIGPELEQEISDATKEVVALIEAGTCECTPEPPELNCASPTFIAGVLARTYWLGFEAGKVDSEDSGE